MVDDEPRLPPTPPRLATGGIEVDQDEDQTALPPPVPIKTLPIPDGMTAELVLEASGTPLKRNKSFRTLQSSMDLTVAVNQGLLDVDHTTSSHQEEGQLQQQQEQADDDELQENGYETPPPQHDEEGEYYHHEGVKSPGSIGSQVQQHQEELKEHKKKSKNKKITEVDSPPQATVLSKIQKWGDYEPYGQVIRGTHVIPMKTPLTYELQKSYLPHDHIDDVAPGQRQDTSEAPPFTIMTFLDQQREQGREVGLIVDLSNHNCLYGEEIPDFLQYQHFSFVAKRLPDVEGCRKVNQAIAKYVSENPNKYVGIHCSYGFNRTGFVVCTYLVEEQGFDVDEALDAFAVSRPPGVKHADFVEELHARYNRPKQLQGGLSATATTSTSTGNNSASVMVRETVVVMSEDGVVGGGAGNGGRAERGGDDDQISQVAALFKNFNISQVNYNEVNNESLGMVSGKTLMEELEVVKAELSSQKQSSRKGSLGQECTLS